MIRLDNDAPVVSKPRSIAPPFENGNKFGRVIRSPPTTETSAV